MSDEELKMEIKSRAEQRAKALLTSLPNEERNELYERAIIRFKQYKNRRTRYNALILGTLIILPVILFWIGFGLAISVDESYFGLIVIAILLIALGIGILSKLNKAGQYNEKWWKSLNENDKVIWQLSYELSGKVKEELILEAKEISIPEDLDFTYSKCIRFLSSETINAYLLIDESRSKFVVKNEWRYTKAYNYSDLLEYEIYENGNSVVKGTAGKAFVGALFFGLGGAIVGSSMSRRVEQQCNDLLLILHINDINSPHIKITYVEKKLLDKNSEEYRIIRDNLQEVCSFLEFMTNQKREFISNESKNSSSIGFDGLRELKKLLDENIITQEEFETKKKEILNL